MSEKTRKFGNILLRAELEIYARTNRHVVLHVKYNDNGITCKTILDLVLLTTTRTKADVLGPTIKADLVKIRAMYVALCDKYCESDSELIMSVINRARTTYYASLVRHEKLMNKFESYKILFYKIQKGVYNELNVER